MYFNKNKTYSFQLQGIDTFPKFKPDNIALHQSRKSVGYSHIRMRSHALGSVELKVKPPANQYSQLAIMPKHNKTKLAQFFQQQKKSPEKEQRDWGTKPTKRPTSSYENNNKNSSARWATPTRSKAITYIDVADRNMESICTKMTQSIILSSQTIESMSEKPVRLSNDNFERLKFLGQGKFGQVYLARHKDTGFICALKIINKQTVRQEGVSQQLAKQVRIHSKLHCLNIIQFYGFFADDMFFYLVMEYATGGSVFAQLKGKSRLEQQQIQPIARGLCQGLNFIHKMGYIHRDIKPDNIVLQFGVPKICDFGWATQCGELEMRKSYCGTPLYLSPEMVRKQYYGKSVDVWAVGLVVYELLVGRVPFSVWNQEDMSEILTKPVHFPEYIDRTKRCEQFILKCLQKQPYCRIQLEQAIKHPFIVQNVPYKYICYSFIELTNQILSKSI